MNFASMLNLPGFLAKEWDAFYSRDDGTEDSILNVGSVIKKCEVKAENELLKKQIAEFEKYVVFYNLHKDLVT